jgi:alanine dehydrogenase
MLIEAGAGLGSGFIDEEYTKAGARVVTDKARLFSDADMIIKVKEPLEPEYNLMREGQIIYTYLHLAADRRLTEVMRDRKVTGIAYETIRGRNGGLPCLKPMSEIAGRLATQQGAKYLEKPQGGRGVLLGGVPGVLPGNVVVLGGAGVVGSASVQMAVGLHANVVAMDVNLDAMTAMDTHYAGRIKTLYSTEANIIDQISTADLVIGAALIPGAAAPKLIKADYLKYMRKGAVIVDVAIDQGGSTETSRLTYHDKPIYTEKGIVHYCVGNMPGSVPITATTALNNATLRYGLMIANMGYKKALKADPGLMLGLNTYAGKITCEPVAEFFKMPYADPNTLI